MSEAAEARVAWASKSQSGDPQFRRNHQASAFFQCLAERPTEKATIVETSEISAPTHVPQAKASTAESVLQKRRYHCSPHRSGHRLMSSAILSTR